MITINEDYVSFETAKLLKEKGFDEKCRSYYKVFPESRIAAIYYSSENRGISEDDPNEILCPTIQMAMKWLREVRNRYIEICTDKAHNFKDIVFRPAIYDKELDCLWESDNFSTYEQACEAAIKYCLENLI